jgi:hypothetical protein
MRSRISVVFISALFCPVVEDLEGLVAFLGLVFFAIALVI